MCIVDCYCESHSTSFESHFLIIESFSYYFHGIAGFFMNHVDFVVYSLPWNLEYYKNACGIFVVRASECCI